MFCLTVYVVSDFCYFIVFDSTCTYLLSLGTVIYLVGGSVTETPLGCIEEISQFDFYCIHGA